MLYILLANDVYTPPSPPESSPGSSVASSPPTSPQKMDSRGAVLSLVNAQLSTLSKEERHMRYLEAHAEDIARLAPEALLKRFWQPMCLVFLIVYALSPWLN